MIARATTRKTAPPILRPIDDQRGLDKSPPLRLVPHPRHRIHERVHAARSAPQRQGDRNNQPDTDCCRGCATSIVICSRITSSTWAGEHVAEGIDRRGEVGAIREEAKHQHDGGDRGEQRQECKERRAGTTQRRIGVAKRAEAPNEEVEPPPPERAAVV